MHKLRPAKATTVHDDHTDVSFRDAAAWYDLPYPQSTGGGLANMLLGDPLHGPFALMSSTRPTDMVPPRGPVHGHDSDTWRITLIGESHMGPASYGPGTFRFQAGGRPYGADDYASGPEGGYHLVMFANRRGFAMRPVKQELVAELAAQDARAAAALGIDVPDEYPEDGRGVATTIGSPDRAGRVDGSFADSDTWPELAPGVRVAAGLVGHRDVGPLLLMLRCEAGATALPPMTLGTEVLSIVVDGSCCVGDAEYAMGDLRVQHADTASPAVTAGPEGLAFVAVVADRQRAGLPSAAELGSAWGPREVLDGLVEELQREHARA